MNGAVNDRVHHCHFVETQYVVNLRPPTLFLELLSDYFHRIQSITRDLINHSFCYLSLHHYLSLSTRTPNSVSRVSPSDHRGIKILSKKSQIFHFPSRYILIPGIRKLSHTSHWGPLTGLGPCPTTGVVRLVSPQSNRGYW